MENDKVIVNIIQNSELVDNDKNEDGKEKVLKGILSQGNLILSRDAIPEDVDLSEMMYKKEDDGLVEVGPRYEITGKVTVLVNVTDNLKGKKPSRGKIKK
jgi:hypothetical protein